MQLRKCGTYGRCVYQEGYPEESTVTGCKEISVLGGTHEGVAVVG